MLNVPPEALLSTGHYHTTCPAAEGIVSQKVAAWVKKDPTLAPSIIRLHFHDCAIRVITNSFSMQFATCIEQCHKVLKHLEEEVSWL